MKKWHDDVVNRFKCWWDNRETKCGETHVNCRDCPFHVPGYSMRDAVKDAIGWFYRLEANQPKWISVEDELPPVGARVLACVGGRVVHEAYIDCNEHWKRANSNHAFLFEITHWMPLPVPPDEAQKDTAKTAATGNGAQGG